MTTKELEQIVRKVVREETVTKEDLQASENRVKTEFRGELDGAEKRIKTELRREFQTGEDRIKTELRTELQTTEERIKAEVNANTQAKVESLADDMADFFNKTWEKMEETKQQTDERLTTIENELGLSHPSKN